MLQRPLRAVPFVAELLGVHANGADERLRWHAPGSLDLLRLLAAARWSRLRITAQLAALPHFQQRRRHRIGIALQFFYVILFCIFYPRRAAHFFLGGGIRLFRFRFGVPTFFPPKIPAKPFLY
jgi:hypothetical protein